MRIGQLLSAISGEPIRDSWIHGRCPDCETVSNLGSSPSETRGKSVVYLCAKCRAVMIEVRPAAGDTYELDVKGGKGGMWIEVPPNKPR